MKKVSGKIPFFYYKGNGDGMKHKIYKRFLKFCIVFGMLGIVLLGYKNIYERVPGRIRLKAGVEQVLDFKIPAEGVIRKVYDASNAVTVSGKTETNVAENSLYVDFSRAVTFRAEKTENYQMDLKLFGFIPFKQVDIEVIRDMVLTPVGEPVGIYVKTDGILVVGIGEFDDENGKKCAPAKYLLQQGDYIKEIEGTEIDEKEDLIRMLEKWEGGKMTLTVLREEETFTVSLQPKENESGEYKLGIWVRDNAQGVGTLTFVDDLGNFGALGHGISDVDTGELLVLESGSLYNTEIISIRKGKNGNPGEMTGMIDYSPIYILGKITANSSKGIYGSGNSKLLSGIDNEALPIGLKQDVKEGPAKIFCNVDGKAKYYDILVEEVYLEHTNVNRGMSIKVTDPELLETTGGIIQGMSGAPIIQDGKLIGAVTHVLVQDATRGYGIFIEEMLK